MEMILRIIGILLNEVINLFGLLLSSKVATVLLIMAIIVGATPALQKGE